jgi:hypothetical protein
MPASHIIQTFLFRAEKPLNALCTYIIQSGQVKLQQTENKMSEKDYDNLENIM